MTLYQLCQRLTHLFEVNESQIKGDQLKNLLSEIVRCDDFTFVNEIHIADQPWNHISGYEDHEIEFRLDTNSDRIHGAFYYKNTPKQPLYFHSVMLHPSLPIPLNDKVELYSIVRALPVKTPAGEESYGYILRCSPNSLKSNEKQ